jgi:NADPH2:quinone reductase
MLAVVCDAYGRLEELQLSQLPDPSPGPGEVVIDVFAAGINFPDLLLVRGLYQFKPEPPFAPGGEAAGVVAALGEGVDPAWLGRAVFGTALHGAFAQKMKLDVRKIAPLPAGLSLTEAAGIGITYGTSLYALEKRAALRAGESLLVLGAAGGVGIAAVQLGKAMGATVIAAASSREKLAVAAAAGADHLIDYSTETLKDRLKLITGGKGVDVVYDPVGGELTEQAFRNLAWDGRHLVIGFASGTIPKLPANLALLKNASLVGVFWGTWTEREPRAAAENLEQIGRWLAEGKLKPLVKAYPMEEFAAALAEVDERRVMGKIVLEVPR